MKKIPKKVGFAISLTGGILSFIFGIVLPIWFSIFYVFGPFFVTTLQMVIIIGGVITIEGAIIFWVKPSMSGKIILIGAIVAGLNIISLAGGIVIIKSKSGS